MTDTVTVGELLDALDPMLREMLTPEELHGAEFWVSRSSVAFNDAGWEVRPLPVGDELDNDMWVRWRVLGEHGGSNSLWAVPHLNELVVEVQSALQDFIAESDFGWGQLRGPMLP